MKMTPQQTVNKLLKTIDESINGFVGGLPDVQKQTYKKLIELVKELDIDTSGNLKNNLNNIKVIGRLKGELETIILSDKYVKDVSDFAKSFDAVKKLNNTYFSSIAVKFADKKVFDEVKKVAVQSTIESLTENGIGANYIDEIKQMLTTNITSGGSYSKLTSELQGYVLGDKNTDGQLTRYGKQIATDSISNFNRQYNKIVSDDLGLTWYQYVGSLLTTSRQFCIEMVNKRYFHESEVSEMLKGQVGNKKVPLSKKTGLPDGMIEGTNTQTFFVNAGGYMCKHVIFPVPTASVPANIRAKFGKD